MSLMPFDANATLGLHIHATAHTPHTPDQLLAELDHHAIAEALVLDTLSRENHPADGNQRILELTAPHPRLHPAWSALPPGTRDEQPAPADFLAQMRACRVGALFLFPNQYCFTLDPWCLDDLLEPLAQARVPVFINPNENAPHASPWDMDRTDWPGVVALCRRFPTLPVIISENRIRRSQRLAYRALDACPNLRLELSGLWLHHALEYITQRWGARRLIFGSNFPYAGHAMTLTTLTCADISDPDKAAIAGDNLRQLLAWCKPTAAAPTSISTPAAIGTPTVRERPSAPTPAAAPTSLDAPNPSSEGGAIGNRQSPITNPPPFSPPPPIDEFHAFARTGLRPPSLTFLDCHGHLGGRAAHYHLPQSALPDIVRQLDRLGVEKVCVFSFTGVFSEETFGNTLVGQAVAEFPDRFVGFTLLNPHRGRDAMLRELDRCAALGLRGVKLIPHYQGYPEDGDLLDVPCQWAHERRQIILDHHWGTNAHLERLLKTFPNACFINGHTALDYAPLVHQYPNLYICSCPLIGPRACEDAVAALGPERLLFGSDLEDLPIAWGLGPILTARVPASIKQKILHDNLAAILARYSLHP